ncbi:mRNA interferase MazF [Pelagirhabdus alkalitolerans]|uniref:mRNA interferase MazF n=1 Tax=Pelagirhabdus alkalitolerans TaxID=1612202 RepID=A0A1G6MYQ1_9BACI|nr:type II toxin-antitoxin system PemK/MazF family toxin [Pelagirhabdus alkalitolerans]SDC60327.1 mRNA interferase MazF [Pelagirhabdus alkalitolerans]
MTSTINQGDLVYITFDSQSENEKRPCIVLSPKLFNQHTYFVAVCPITTQKKNYPFEVELPEGLNVNGVILTDQIKSIDKKTCVLKVFDTAPDSVINECLDKIYAFLPKREI